MKKDVCICSDYSLAKVIELKTRGFHPIVQPCEDCGRQIIVSPTSKQLEKSVRLVCKDCGDKFAQRHAGDVALAMSPAQLQEVFDLIDRDKAKNN